MFKYAKQFYSVYNYWYIVYMYFPAEKNYLLIYLIVFFCNPKEYLTYMAVVIFILCGDMAEREVMHKKHRAVCKSLIQIR